MDEDCVCPVHTPRHGSFLADVARIQSKVLLVPVTPSTKCSPLSLLPVFERGTFAVVTPSQQHKAGRAGGKLDQETDVRVGNWVQGNGSDREMAVARNHGEGLPLAVAPGAAVTVIMLLAVAPRVWSWLVHLAAWVVDASRADGCLRSSFCEREGSVVKGAQRGQQCQWTLFAFRVCFLLPVVCLLVPLTTATLDPAQRQALVDVYNATSGPLWKSKTGWASYTDSSSDPCTNSWLGVLCDPSNQIVTCVLSAHCQWNPDGD